MLQNTNKRPLTTNQRSPCRIVDHCATEIILSPASQRTGDRDFMHRPCIPVHMAELLHSVDRKSTRLNSSHANISYAVFCLKKNTQQLWSLNEEHTGGVSPT